VYFATSVTLLKPPYSSSVSSSIFLNFHLRLANLIVQFVVLRLIFSQANNSVFLRVLVLAN
jgi:hypothetical protein